MFRIRLWKREENKEILLIKMELEKEKKNGWKS